MKKNKNFIIIFGLQYLAIHGILFLIIELKFDLIMGLLHRGTEKLIEYKMYFQSMPYFDRLDNVLMIAQKNFWLYDIINIEIVLNLL